MKYGLTKGLYEIRTKIQSEILTAFKEANINFGKYEIDDFDWDVTLDYSCERLDYFIYEDGDITFFTVEGCKIDLFSLYMDDLCYLYECMEDWVEDGSLSSILIKKE
jgi:hypothetical protein